jgi:hypothetical protein
MANMPAGGPGTQKNPQGGPKPGHGGSNTKVAEKEAPQNTNTKGNGAQKRKQET